MDRGSPTQQVSLCTTCASRHQNTRQSARNRKVEMQPRAQRVGALSQQPWRVANHITRLSKVASPIVPEVTSW